MPKACGAGGNPGQSNHPMRNGWMEANPYHGTASIPIDIDERATTGRSGRIGTALTPMPRHTLQTDFVAGSAGRFATDIEREVDLENDPTDPHTYATERPSRLRDGTIGQFRTHYQTTLPRRWDGPDERCTGRLTSMGMTRPGNTTVLATKTWEQGRAWMSRRLLGARAQTIHSGMTSRMPFVKGWMQRIPVNSKAVR
jgi:hypothetical protein